MKSFTETIKPYIWRQGLNEKYSSLMEADPEKGYLSMTAEEAWHNGHPSNTLYLATCPGILPAEEVRLFGLWSVLELRHLIEDYSCIRALNICENYYNRPYPEKLYSAMDMINTPSMAREYIKFLEAANEPDMEALRNIFEIAEFSHKTWRSTTDAEECLCFAVHGAISTLSEPHCRERGYVVKNDRFSAPPPAIAATDDFLVGLNRNAETAAGCASETLGKYASVRILNEFVDGDYRAEMENIRVIAEVEKKQAVWLRNNVHPVFY